MKFFTEKGIYEVVYRDTHFSYLQLIRIDTICDICYFTCENILTGEMLTFEESGIVGIREISGVGEAS